MTGSLKKNAKLKSVKLNRIANEKSKKAITISKVNNQFPVAQIKTFGLSGYECKNFDLSKMKKLEKLFVTGNWNRRLLTKIQKINLTKKKNLTNVSFNRIKLNKLDLRKNSKLLDVRVISGNEVSESYEEGTGDEPGFQSYYVAVKGTNSQILLPKKNKIKVIRYFSSSKQIDVTQCKKLKTLQVPKGMKVKLLKKWYKKSSLLIQKNNDPVYSSKIPKKGKYIWV